MGVFGVPLLSGKMRGDWRSSIAYAQNRSDERTRQLSPGGQCPTRAERLFDFSAERAMTAASDSHPKRQQIRNERVAISKSARGQ
jgi:hypothetical protein